MTIYRLHKSRYAANDTTGSRLRGGRYNSPGVGALYASSSAAGTILELRVYLAEQPLDEYVLSTCDVDESRLSAYDTADILGWDDPKGRASRAQAFGDGILKQTSNLGFRAPSLTTGGNDSSIILNPSNQDFHSLAWTSVPFEFDERLWLVPHAETRA